MALTSSIVYSGKLAKGKTQQETIRNLKLLSRMVLPPGKNNGLHTADVGGLRVCTWIRIDIGITTKI